MRLLSLSQPTTLSSVSSIRFIGLVKDVDNVIDWVWESLLNMIQGLTTMFYFILVCIIHLGLAIPKYAGETVGVFFKSASLFLFLGLLTMAAPVIWFRLFDSTVQECEYKHCSERRSVHQAWSTAQTMQQSWMHKQSSERRSVH